MRSRAVELAKAQLEPKRAQLREAEIPGREVEFDPDEAEKIAFYEDALSDQDARESVEDL